MQSLEHDIFSAIGNTPLVQIDGELSVFAKLEGMNIYGSMKDRAAAYVISQLLKNNVINQETEIIESSSGNFAVALAGICKAYKLKFTCVSDPLMNPTTRAIIKTFGANIDLVTESDENNIFVENRLKRVYELTSRGMNMYWVNQYDSQLVIEAYRTLAKEIIQQKPDVQYVFIPVSTCGTIAGVSRTLKEYNQSIRIVAVDLESSSIFQAATTGQHLPGMGFNKRPGNISSASIDDNVIVNEIDCIYEGRKLLEQGLFVGASSGGTIAGIKKYFSNSSGSPNIVAIFPDRGDRYIDNIYNNDWCRSNFPEYDFNSIF